MQPSFVGRVLDITGAGISADTGLRTFRGQNALWRTYSTVFDYIIGWALRVKAAPGTLIAINPDPTPLSSSAQRVRCDRCADFDVLVQAFATQGIQFPSPPARYE